MSRLACGSAVACGVLDDEDDGFKVIPPLLSSVKHLVKSNGGIVGREIAEEITPHYPTLMSVLPPATKNTGPAFLASIDGRLPLQHARVGPFLQEVGNVLHHLRVGRGHRVALVLPIGPELALAILAVSQWATVVPLSATSASQELTADLQRCGADLVIGPYSEGPLPQRSEESVEDVPPRLAELAAQYGVMNALSRDWTVHHHVQETAVELGISFCGLVPDPVTAGPFRLVLPDSDKKKKTRTAARQRMSYESLAVSTINEETDDTNERYAPNSGNDEALVLFTSGTTGNKKLVAHQMADLLVAATTIALSWDLQPTDVNCNLMPLFHVGGIVRQVYAPLVSGGCVICCPNFDADIFWALITRNAFNWYYAAPTMHSIILQIGKSIIGTNGNKYTLKMIANAAGGLLPSLAEDLRKTFQATVLPSYGMTECMPISSPPVSYDLSKPGTSGVPVGPEVAILNLAKANNDGDYTRLAPGQEGPICVRGEPCFRGYGVLANDPNAKMPELFLGNNWFNTGDLGFLDSDGYLFITGRAKEVINRGGEIISPMEVEEAVQSHPDVRACAAFAANHDVLQETVGIVIVPEPGRPRSLDLSTLHTFIADKLAQPKWPQCLVFMEKGLPKSHTNKLLRVKLGSRLGLPEFNDNMTTWDRTFDATCPQQGAPLDTPIPSSPVAVVPELVEEKLRTATKSSKIDIVPHPSRPGALIAYLQDADLDRLKFIETAMTELHRYEVPTHVCFAKEASKIKGAVPSPKDAVTSLLSQAESSETGNTDPLVGQLQDIFLSLLDLDYVPSPNADFFHIGGNSMRASQLAAKIRRSFQVSCSGAEIFHHSSCADLASLIKSRTDASQKRGDLDAPLSGSNGTETNRDAQGAPFDASPMPPQASFLGAIVQLLPMFVVFPMWQISRYLLFFFVLLMKSRMFRVSDRNFTTFLGAYVVYYLLWITFAPLVFVLIKWTVVGRYKAGRYPVWGSYYLRWWFVDVCRKLVLRGIWGSSPTTLRWYYRMLGARIDEGARISRDCDFAEYDLVSVGRDAALDLSTVRGFGVDHGAIMLGAVEIGSKASVGLRSVVAPHTCVPDGQHLGPASSSYDKDALHPKFATVNRQLFPQPSACLQFFIGWPLLFLVNTAAQVPSMAVLYSLLWFKSRETTDYFFDNWNDLMDWLCDPKRIPFFFGIRIARALFSPFCYMAMALLVKWVVIGRIQPGPRNLSSDWDKFRVWLASELFPRKKVQALTDMIGRHYEGVSVLYRLLGAKVGKRVFWPGNQPIVNGTYDLLEVGDDAVFGSRSILLSASTSRMDTIVLCAGANVSDNCVVLPGTVVGKNAVLGSNSISRQGAYLPAGSVWFGNAGAESRCLEPGDGNDSDYYQPMADESGSGGKSTRATMESSQVDPSRLPMTGDETTLRPFGKAVYYGLTNRYMVLPIPLIVLYTWTNRIFVSIFHTMPLMAAIQLGAVLLYSDDPLSQTYRHFTNSHDNDWADSYEAYHAYDDDLADQVPTWNSDRFFWLKRDFDNEGHHHNYWEVFWAVFVAFLVTHFVQVIGWLVVELSAKWIIMGKRKSGRYNYDTSSYAQRWEMYQLTAKIRKISRLNLLQFLSGTPYLTWYFRLNGGKIGKNCCLYPSGADPFMPEPDLVTIGDGTVVDCASIVCHLNTRGNFELAPITIENNCTLRTRSRVQSGVHMEAGSMLLEKSIAMTGEVLDARSVWQGGPSTLWFRSKEVSQYSPPEHQIAGPKNTEKEGIELSTKP